MHAKRCCASAASAAVLLFLSLAVATAQPSDLPCGTPGFPCCTGEDGSRGTYGSSDSSPEGECNENSFCSPTGICAACGFPGNPCCPGGACADEATSTCNTAAGFCESTCGEPGLPCCPGGAAEECKSNSITVCSAGMCTRCGNAGQACCDSNAPRPCDYDDYYDFTLECDAATNTCVEPSCGRIGLPCCTADADGGDPYNGGCTRISFCDGGECSACGYFGQPCCPVDYLECRDYSYEMTTYVSGECSPDGLSCTAAIIPRAPPPAPPPAPEGCGSVGLPCCGSDDDAYFGECYGEFSTCVAGLCTSCGFQGDQCCVGGAYACGDETYSYCNDGDLCSGACGFEGSRCCTVDPRFPCRFGLECDAAVDTCVPQAE